MLHLLISVFNSSKTVGNLSKPIVHSANSRVEPRDFVTVAWYKDPLCSLVLLKKPRYKSLLAIAVNQGKICVYLYNILEAVLLCFKKEGPASSLISLFGSILSNS